jgi:hypothetical protein
VTVNSDSRNIRLRVMRPMQHALCIREELHWALLRFGFLMDTTFTYLALTPARLLSGRVLAQWTLTRRRYSWTRAL